jgi:hypothetical protein
MVSTIESHKLKKNGRDHERRGIIEEGFGRSLTLALSASVVLAVAPHPKQRLFLAAIFDPPPTPVLLGPLEAELLCARLAVQKLHAGVASWSRSTGAGRWRR